MQDKIILNNFSAKISKAKILHDSTAATCDKLKKQAEDLQRQLTLLRSQRQSAQILQHSLQDQLQLSTTKLAQQKTQCQQQKSHLNQLKQQKKKLSHQNDVLNSDIQKQKLKIEELSKQRQRLEQHSIMLTQKLKQTTTERQVLEEELRRTRGAIKKYDQGIKDLKGEIQRMKVIIEDNTRVNVVGGQGEQKTPKKKASQ